MLSGDIVILHRKPLKDLSFSSIWGGLESEAYESQADIINNCLEHSFIRSSIILEDPIVSFNPNMVDSICKN